MIERDQLPLQNSKAVPGDEGTFPFYNTFKHRDLKWDLYMREKYGKVWASRIFSGKLIIVTDFDTTRQVCTQQENLLKMSYLPSTQIIMGSDSLLFLEGEKHRVMRKMLNPMFEQSSINARMEFIRKAAQESMNKFVTGTEDEIVAVYDLVKWYLAKVLIWILFGYESDDERLEEFADWAYEMTDGAFDFFTFNLPFTRFGKAKRARKAVTAWIDDLISSRDKLNPDCILKILLDTKDQNGRPLSRKAIDDTMILLTVAGVSTTRDAASRLFQNLAQYPDVANRLREELDNVDLEQCAASKLGDLQYLDGVLRETLRLNPPVGAVVRQAIEDIDTGKYLFPKDTVIFFSFSQAWKTDPMFVDMKDEMAVANFCPDRWSVPLAKEKGQYFPFGLGSHACIGLHLAQLEMKLLIASYVKEYEWKLMNSEKVWFVEGALYKPYNGLPISVNKRYLRNDRKYPTLRKPKSSVGIQARLQGLQSIQRCCAKQTLSRLR
eukprot:TRINITY_DN932_c0_g1_i2.p1 TRINITY_DN932_c0_g1~~TRINITY_DN932_c0_g1_i2.p1  ORF type:complete len:493 (+),score=43.95 TRINITY_DN932_c0_g1_i2:127-1605(+)